MNKDDIIKILKCSIKEIIEGKDNYLLKNDIHENSISHRLAVILEKSFHDYDIDCEYDGNVDSKKGNKKKYIKTLITPVFRNGTP